MFCLNLKTFVIFVIDTPYGNVDDTYQYFKEILLCHSVKVGEVSKYCLKSCPPFTILTRLL